MDDSRINNKTPFRQSDGYLLLFLIIALLLINAILNLLFGYPSQKYAVNDNINYATCVMYSGENNSSVYTSNLKTKIKFSLQEADIEKLDIYNILGQKVTAFINQRMNSGIYQAEFIYIDCK